MTNMPQLPAQQRGIALLTVLLMVAMASVMAMSILDYQERMLKENTVLLRQDQAQAYAKSAEYFLSELLVQDVKNGNQNDNLSQDWAQPMPVLPIENGSITGRLIDQSGKFNINNLFHDGKRDDNAVAYFSRLLQRVGLQPELAAAVLDWQDPDDKVTDAMGAEDSFYLGQQPAYLTANRAFQSVGELKKVRGFTAASVEKLSPYIAALPAFSAINVNTATAVVLSAMDDSLSVDTVQQWVEARDSSKQYLNQSSALWSMPPFQKISTTQRSSVNPLLSVRSNFFKAEISVNVDKRHYYLTSQLYRQGQAVLAYNHSLQPLPPAPDQNSGQQMLQQLLSNLSP